MESRKIALAKHLNTSINYDNNDIPTTKISSLIMEVGDKQYLVCTEDEANIFNEAKLNDDIRDNILPKIPEAYRDYFNKDMWKQDRKIYGRGVNLARYDGIEYKIKLPEENKYFCIYRIT